MRRWNCNFIMLRVFPKAREAMHKVSNDEMFAAMWGVAEKRFSADHLFPCPISEAAVIIL